MVERRKRKACAYKKKKFVQGHHLIAYNVEEITDIFSINTHKECLAACNTQSIQYTFDNMRYLNKNSMKRPS